MKAQRWIIATLYLACGITLIVLGFFGKLESFGGGLAAALTAVGILRLMQAIRYKTDQNYREATDTAATDERNRFIRAKAWSWVGYLYIIIAAVATIAFKLLGQETLMFAASGSVCLMVVLYWIIYLILDRKY